jgi:hypothetical protein
MSFQNQKILNVRFINSQNSEYRAYCRRMNLEKKINTIEKIIDPTIYVSSWLESAVVSKIKNNQTFHEDNILQIDMLGPTNIISRKYKELDGVFNLTNDSVTVLEIKASQSKSSVSRGINQLNNTRKILQSRFKNITSILVSADCRSLCSTFGQAEFSLIEALAKENNYILFNDLDLISKFRQELNCLYLIDSDTVLKFTDIYGSPNFEADDYV